MNKPTDVTILYQGGSGGFALFYYLLLSGNYQTGLDYNDINELINTQFNLGLINNPKKWKDLEFWPNNLACKNSNKSPKLFLICNPTWNGMTEHNLNISNNTYKILLYTDLKLQLRMAYEKQAYWFTQISKKEFNAPVNDRDYIQQIINNYSEFENCKVDPRIGDIVDQFLPNQYLKLQDFINTKRILDFPEPNQLQIDFLNIWVDLQPKKSKRLLKN